MLEITEAILRYESDTFSASALEVKHSEAYKMAEKLHKCFLDMIQGGGRMHCDGDVLSELLDEVRR